MDSAKFALQILAGDNLDALRKWILVLRAGILDQSATAGGVGTPPVRAARVRMRLNPPTIRTTITVALCVGAGVALPACGTGARRASRPVSTKPDTARSRSPAGDSSPTPVSRGALQAALSGAVQQVTQRYGTVQVAVMLDSWTQPLLLGEQLANPMRLWSLSKPVVATTLLRQREERDSPTTDLALYLERAMRRSDNCAMRELTIKLQDDTGGIAGARAAIEETAGLAGANVEITDAQTDTEGSVCISPTYAGLSPSFAHRRALLAGTATWTIDDAIHFVHGLQAGALDVPGHPSISGRLLGLMRLTKEPSDEPLAGHLTAPPTWGAGDVFTARCWNVAYKAGWGGAQAHIPWLASQIGSVALAGGHHLDFAVAVHPYTQPPDDDPGLTDAPRGISLVLRTLRTYLQSEQLCK